MGRRTVSTGHGRGRPPADPAHRIVKMNVGVRPWHRDILARIAATYGWTLSEALREILDAYLAEAGEPGLDQGVETDMP